MEVEQSGSGVWEGEVIKLGSRARQHGGWARPRLHADGTRSEVMAGVGKGGTRSKGRQVEDGASDLNGEHSRSGVSVEPALGP